MGLLRWGLKKKQQRTTVSAFPREMVGGPNKPETRPSGVGFMTLLGWWTFTADPNENWLVVEPTPLKTMLVKMGISLPNFRGENSKHL